MTTIEWTDESWNPIRARNLATGGLGHFCVHASPGCKGCYAEKQQPRYKNPIRYAMQDLALVEPFLDEKVLLRPLGWKRGREIFPCSMTDLFAPFHHDDWIDAVLAVAALTPQHTYQCLTKQYERMNAYFSTPFRHRRIAAQVMRIASENPAKVEPFWGDLFIDLDLGDPKAWPLRNWRQGVSVESQEWADKRISVLLKTPGIAKRWISAEPLLDVINIRPYLEKDMRIGPNVETSLDWVVVGGESGHKARPFQLEWAERLLWDCTETRVPIFVKQLGRRPYFNGDPFLTKHTKGGDPKEWPEFLRVRERMAA